LVPPRSDYVELRCRSSFSFLEACSNPEDLIECAARLGHPALALADRAGLYGAPRFHQAAVAAGVRAIVGAEVDVARDDADGSPDALLLLAESARGYRNLCRIVTEGHARAGKEGCRVRWDELEAHAAGLVALVRGDSRLRPALLARSSDVFRERLWVDVSRHATRASEVALRRAAALAESARVPVVATNDVRHARPEGRALFDALTCLRHKTSLESAGRLLAENAERHLRAP
jgi:error-prone DNA polymerase